MKKMIEVEEIEEIVKVLQGVLFRELRNLRVREMATKLEFDRSIMKLEKSLSDVSKSLAECDLVNAVESLKGDVSRLRSELEDITMTSPLMHSTRLESSEESCSGKRQHDEEPELPDKRVKVFVSPDWDTIDHDWKERLRPYANKKTNKDKLNAVQIAFFFCIVTEMNITGKA